MGQVCESSIVRSLSQHFQHFISTSTSMRSFANIDECRTFAHVIFISHFHFQSFSSRSQVEYIQHSVRRIYVDLMCFRPNFDLDTCEYIYFSGCQSTWSYILNSIFFMSFARSKSHLMRPNNELARSNCVFHYQIFVAQRTPMHPTAGAEHAFVTISESERFASSIPPLPSSRCLRADVSGVFVYHGFAVPLAPWFASLVQCLQKSANSP
jgi:hypothetical protein